MVDRGTSIGRPRARGTSAPAHFMGPAHVVSRASTPGEAFYDVGDRHLTVEECAMEARMDARKETILAG